MRARASAASIRARSDSSQLDLGRPRELVDLVGAARPDDGAGDRRVVQRPRDGHLGDGPPVPRGDVAQDVDDAQRLVSCGSLNHAAFRRQSSSGSDGDPLPRHLPESSPDCIGE